MSNSLFKKIIIIEIVGFSLIIIILWCIEIFDLPHIIFHAMATPINYVECIIETTLIMPFSFLIIAVTVKMLNKIKHIAMHDSLTDLVNRRFILEYLNHAVRSNLKSKRMYSFIMCDIDDFKKINDLFGHECGDKILKNVASLLKEVTRPQDLTCRWGGEEFLIFLPDISLETTIEIANRIKTVINNNHFSYENNSFNVTLSFGISNHIFGMSNFDEAIKEADQNLYSAKKQGKNRIEYIIN